MNRRTFLRLLSTIPLIDIPALLEGVTPAQDVWHHAGSFFSVGRKVYLHSGGIVRGSPQVLDNDGFTVYMGDEPSERWYSTGGTTWFVAEDGDDEKDGLTPETAKKTFAAVLQRL